MKKKTSPEITSLQPIRVLVIEDSEDDVLLIMRELKKGGYNPVYEQVETATAMKKALKEKGWDIILCDYNLPNFNGSSAIALLKETNIDIPLIIVSGTIGEDKAVECMRLGAQDYILKTNFSRLCPAIARELEDKKIRNKQRQAESQREATLEALHQSEEKHKTIIENIQEGYFETDSSGNFIFFNDSMCRCLGYSPEELMGMNYKKYTDIVNAKKLFNIFNEVYKTGFTGRILDYEIIRKDGTKRQLEGFVSLQKNSPNTPILFRGTVRDITERKQAEEILRQRERKFRLLTEKMSDIVWMTDMTLRTIYITPSIWNVLGFTQEERINQTIEEQLTPNSLSLGVEAMDRELALEKQGHVDDNRNMTLELEYYHKDGSTRWMETLISGLRNDHGILTGLHCVARDITLRRKAEEKFEKIFMTTPDCIAITRLCDGLMIDVNKGFEDIVGWKKEITIGTKSTEPPMNFWVDISARDFMAAELKAGRDILHCEFEFRRADGSIRNGIYSARSINIVGEACLIFILLDITEQKRMDAELRRTLESLRRAVGTTIQVMISAIEMRDPYTAGHQSRVADIARAIATEMRLSPEKIDGIRMAGTIHDIGKLSIPAEILSKPTKLTNLEYSLIKEHSQNGFEMLQNVESPWPLAEIVHQHHERMNGTGYPKNLKGNEIILEARILSVADVVEAMSSHRPYRASMGIDAALEEIERNKGILYDEIVVNACLKLFRKKGYKIP